jgi:hypothetical protein
MLQRKDPAAAHCARLYIQVNHMLENRRPTYSLLRVAGYARGEYFFSIAMEAQLRSQQPTLGNGEGHDTQRDQIERTGGLE